MRRSLTMLGVVLCFCLVFAGCGLLNKMKQDFQQSESILEDRLFEEPLMVLDPPVDPVVFVDEMKLISLYFADPLTEKLVVEEREIPKVTGLARATVEELIKGPLSLGLEAALPAGTRLLDINVREDGLAIVDFSADLIKDLPVTVSAEKLAVYSIVNTLTQFPTVQEVEMRVEGKKLETLLGYLQFADNLTRDLSLLQ